jgi:hypothetical protein
LDNAIAIHDVGAGVMNIQNATAESYENLSSSTHQNNAPRPSRVAETGLSRSFLCDLLSKHLLSGRASTLADLVQTSALSGGIVEDLVGDLRDEARVEVLGRHEHTNALRFSLTDRGRNRAFEAMLRSSYAGPAPVPLKTYARIVAAQSIHGLNITKDMVDDVFADVVVSEHIREQLGLSMNSGKSTFVYGPAGTGKTYLTSKLPAVFNDDVLVPHAISVGDTVMSVFDPLVHRAIGSPESSSLLLEEGFDRRFVGSERPVVVTGGELTAEMLEVQYDASAKEYLAPLQLKANNGIFIIDDMGRQRVSPSAIFNRWIVPLEERTDYLALGSGRHFSSPFDVVLVFSTNMNPLDLADEAFLRRIGYKIEFPHLTPDEYQKIWVGYCHEKGISQDTDVIDYTINVLHATSNTPLLPCHPRDLLGMAVDQTKFQDLPKHVTKDHIDKAWKSYFVSMSTASVESSSGRGI